MDAGVSFSPSHRTEHMRPIDWFALVFAIVLAGVFGLAVALAVSS